MAINGWAVRSEHVLFAEILFLAGNQARWRGHSMGIVSAEELNLQRLVGVKVDSVMVDAEPVDMPAVRSSAVAEAVREVAAVRVAMPPMPWALVFEWPAMFRLPMA